MQLCVSGATLDFASQIRFALSMERRSRRELFSGTMDPARAAGPRVETPAVAGFFFAGIRRCGAHTRDRRATLRSR